MKNFIAEHEPAVGIALLVIMIISMATSFIIHYQTKTLVIWDMLSVISLFLFLAFTSWALKRDE